MKKYNCKPSNNCLDVYRIKTDLKRLKSYLDEYDPELKKITIHIDDFVELGRLGCPAHVDDFVKKYKIDILVCGGEGTHIEPGHPEIETWSEFYQDPANAMLLARPYP